ncbi:MAG TPA: septum formation initiator family protein [Terriglobales bacterium]|nr:septum formation initiator family protein [Terriglobales bacterium]
MKRFPNFRVLQKPQNGFQTLVQRAPEAEALADRAMEKLLPTLTVAYTFRRRIATGLVGVLTIWLFIHVMFGANGMVVYRQKRAEYQSLQKEIDSLQKENDHYSKQINALKTDPKTIEKEAREALHYTKPGEFVYVSPNAANAPIPATNSAKR